jgi:hypothetical protein
MTLDEMPVAVMSVDKMIVGEMTLDGMPADVMTVDKMMVVEML